MTAVLAQVRYHDGMGWDDGASWVMVLTMGLVALVAVGVVVWAVVYLTRAGAGRTGPVGPSEAPGPHTPSARDVLDQRYARGEIDTADYEERRSKLG